MYGCYPRKLASTLGYPESDGQRLYDAFWKYNEPIRLLVEDLEDEYDRNGGWIEGLDGRPLFIREKRKILNTLLQNAAAMVFKRWMVLVDNQIVLYWNRLHQIIAYHDELQFEATTEESKYLKIYSKVIKELALKSGDYYSVRVPTPADVKIGKNWADTH